jgi:hypothetical protein
MGLERETTERWEARTEMGAAVLVGRRSREDDAFERGERERDAKVIQAKVMIYGLRSRFDSISMGSDMAWHGVRDFIPSLPSRSNFVI